MLFRSSAVTAASEVSSLVGYTIHYEVSNTVPTSNTSIGGLQNSTSASYTKGETKKTYYVWAYATKSGRPTVGSKNYSVVKMGHSKHIGDTINGGDCYTTTTVPCTDQTKYHYVFTKPSTSYTLSIKTHSNGNKRYCPICCSVSYAGTHYMLYQNTSECKGATCTVVCGACGVKGEYTLGGAASTYYCNSHGVTGTSGVFSKTIAGTTYTFNNCVYWSDITTTGKIYNSTNGSLVGSLPHGTVYTLNCSLRCRFSNAGEFLGKFL